MIFRNLQLYRIAGEWKLTPGELEERLAKHPLAPCMGLNPQSRGWVSPTGTTQLVYAQGRQMLIALGVEQKLLPSTVVKQTVDERAAELAQRQGFKPGRKQLLDLKDQVIAELMPRAFAKQRSTRAWINCERGWIVVDAASPARAEELLEVLRDAVEGLTLELPELALSPAAAMTKWLADGDAPFLFDIDQDGELRGNDQTKPVVRYTRHNLDGAEIRNHIAAGKQVTWLGLRWNNRVSFRLTDKFEIKRLRFEDIEKTQEDAATQSPEEQFDADFALFWGTASELILDLCFALDGPKPLAEATLKRIARGIMRYVVDAANPFIVPIANYGSGVRVNSADEPLTTVTANPKGGAHALVVPTLVGVGSRAGQSRPRGVDEPTATTKTKYDTALVAAHITKFRTGSVGSGMDEPMHTVTASSHVVRPGGAAPLGVVAAHLMHVTHHGDERGHEMREPVPTVTGAQRGEQALIAATMVQTGYGEREGQAPRALDVGQPLGTVVGGGSKHAVVAAFLAQHNSERVGVKAGKDARDPLSTTCASGSHQSVVTSHLLKLRGTCKDGQPVDEPMPTVTASGTHAAEVRAFLVAYYGNDKDGQGVNEPLRTMPTRDRFGLVTVRGELYQIVDIGMRMLTPRELANAQGFPSDYVIDRGADGKPLTKTAQVRMIGNSVCPPVAEALVRANFQHELKAKAKARRAA